MAEKQTLTKKEQLQKRKRILRKWIRNTALTVVCIFLGILIALQYKSLKAAGKEDRAALAETENLTRTINRLYSELEQAEIEKEELQQRLDVLLKGNTEQQIEQLAKELHDIRTFAGLTTVQGEGLSIELQFSDPDDLVRTQDLLLILINELRASSAQAISINGQRILAMSEIRVLNDRYIAVNGVRCTTPLTIVAIGNSASMQSTILMGGSNSTIENLKRAGCIVTWSAEKELVIQKGDDSLIKTNYLTSLDDK